MNKIQLLVIKVESNLSELSKTKGWNLLLLFIQKSEAFTKKEISIHNSTIGINMKSVFCLVMFIMKNVVRNKEVRRRFIIERFYNNYS
jgi:hypothetical protein